MRQTRVLFCLLAWGAIFFVTATGSEAFYGYQHEPNDTWAQAEWLPLFSYGWHSSSGTVSSSDPSDFYFFYAHSFPHKYKLHLYNQSSGDIDLWVHNGTTSEALWASVEYGSVDEELEGTLNGPGDNAYFIVEVKYHSGDGDLAYTVSNLSGDPTIPLGPPSGIAGEYWLGYDTRFGDPDREYVADLRRILVTPASDNLKVDGPDDATLYMILWPESAYNNVEYAGFIGSDFGGYAPGQDLTIDLKDLAPGNYVCEVGMWESSQRVCRYNLLHYRISDDNDDCASAQWIPAAGISGQTTGIYDQEDWYHFDIGAGYGQLKVIMYGDRVDQEDMYLFKDCPRGASDTLDWFSGVWGGNPEVSTNNPTEGSYIVNVRQVGTGDVTYSLVITASSEDCSNDITAPETYLNGCPYPDNLPATTTSHTFVLGGRDNCTQAADLTYEWALYKDKNMVNGWTPESWLFVGLQNLTPGWFDFYARAVDSAGNKDKSLAYCGFRIDEANGVVQFREPLLERVNLPDLILLNDPCADDADAPDTFIDNCPQPNTLPSNTTQYTFNVSGTDPNDCTPASELTYQWALYGNSLLVQGWTDDDAVIDVTSLSAGWFDFFVRSVDNAGNEDASEAYCGFHVAAVDPCLNDTTPPDTWINNCPYPADLPSSVTQYTFDVGGNDNCTATNQLTYQWSLYKDHVMVNGWTNDDNLIDLTNLGPGWYDFHLRAVDTSGNKDASTAYCGFRIKASG